MLRSRLHPLNTHGRSCCGHDFGEMDAIILRPDLVEPVADIPSQHERVGSRLPTLLVVGDEAEIRHGGRQRCSCPPFASRRWVSTATLIIARSFSLGSIDIRLFHEFVLSETNTNQTDLRAYWWRRNDGVREIHRFKVKPAG
jgi:hypothetical protein